MQKKSNIQKKSQLDIELEERKKKLEFERKIKKSNGYESGCKKLINASDHQGKTALHYAVLK